MNKEEINELCKKIMNLKDKKKLTLIYIFLVDNVDLYEKKSGFYCRFDVLEKEMYFILKFIVDN
jgi:hypothetical protein